MSNAAITIEGFISNELKVRDVTNHRIVDVTIPVTPQKKVDGKWEDSGDTVWYKASFWDELGDAVLQTVNKGTLVTVSGIPRLDLYLKQGDAAGSIAIDFPTIAVVVRKGKRGGASQQPTEEPWAAQEPAGDTWSTPSSYDDSHTPF